MKTKMMTKVILTVFTLALGIRPREEALRVSCSCSRFPAAVPEAEVPPPPELAAAAAAVVCMVLPFFQMVMTIMM